MSFRGFLREVKQGTNVEGDLVKTILTSLLTSFVVLAILYFSKFRFIDGFMGKYGFFLFFAVLAYALLSGVLIHIRAFGQFPCMSGMMLGMTTGMIAGFLSGYFIASTNGMFVGSVFGMVFGIFIGVIAGGKTCGVMGFLEGVMAGFMGGLMGAMTAFMLFNDNLKPATFIVFIVSAVILVALNYMLYLEGKQMERRRQSDRFFTIAFTFVATVVTTWLMVFGPRSGVFG